MNIAEAKLILPFIPAEFTPMLKGVHGIGKTEVVRQIAEEFWHQPCVELQGSQLSDVGDLIGLQRIDAETGHTEWVPPYWCPVDGKPITLFLDELNRTPLSIKRAMMQVGNDHRLLNFKLPEGSHVIVAVNPGEDGNYDVEEFDPAEFDRFLPFDLTPTVQEWIDFMQEKGYNSTVVQYIAQNSGDLDPFNKEVGKTTSKNFDGVLPSRRSWTKLAITLDQWEKAGLPDSMPNFGAHLQTLVGAYVGKHIAANFKTFYMAQGKGLTAKAIMEATDFNKKYKKKVEELCDKQALDAVRLGTSVCVYLHEHENEMKDGTKITKYGEQVAKNWLAFLKACKPEIQVKIYKDGVRHARDQKYAWVSTLSRADSAIRDLYLEITDMDI